MVKEFSCLVKLEPQPVRDDFPVPVSITGSKLRSLDATVVEANIVVHGVPDSPVSSNTLDANSLVSLIGLGFGRGNLPS